MIRQYELVERVKKYDPKADENLLNRAYVFSMKAHGTQLRASGDPYFSHPLEVAGILTNMGLDHHTIVTALLHDTIEDTVATVEEIEELFGKKIAELVDGVTKLSRLELQTENAREAENFRKFLLALSNDIRVLLVKLADRLHNMRTLHHIKREEKRRRIAKETMEIYAPLAERIGMRAMKDELEDLAFKVINPEAYDTILQRLKFLRQQGKNIKSSIARVIRNSLKKEGIISEVSGREKSPHSIWSKMEREHITFEQLSDVMAFRVIVDDTTTCYDALGVIHRKWAMIPGQFDDYISTPKRNRYQSIHTAVIGPRKLRIEIQIRTREMHEIAERGVAAHWQYKQGTKKTEKGQYQWIQDFLEILEQASTPEEFLEHTKLEMFQDQVFCFTPKGELISLPRGSTPVDFAYAVHTAVGDSCVGAKVNGRVVPLRHQLENGDGVEIIRSRSRKPSPRWQNFVVTGKARSAIRRYVNKSERKEFRVFGKSILERAFQKVGLEFSESAVAEGLENLKLKKREDLYELLGQGHLTDREAMRAIFPGTKFKYNPKARRAFFWRGSKKSKQEDPIPIQGLTPGMAVQLSECCHPLPGDRIVGLMTEGEGVAVHTLDCESLADQPDDPDRLIDISWRETSGQADFKLYAGRVKAVMANESGVLADIATIVAKQGGNISNLKISERDPDFFTMLIDIEVNNDKHLTSIITALRAMKLISRVERLRG